MEEKPTTKIHWWRIAIWIVIAVLVILFFTKIHYTLIVFGLSALSAYLLTPGVKFFYTLNIPRTKKKLSWTSSVIIVYLILSSVIVVSLIILIPMLVDQINNLITNAPALSDKIQLRLSDMEQSYQNYNIPIEIKEKLNDYLSEYASKAGIWMVNMLKSVGHLILTTFSWCFLIFMALFISLFILLDLENIQLKFYSLIPPDYQDDVKKLLYEINAIFGNYVKGYGFLCIINGVLTYIFLLFPGLYQPYPRYFQYNLIVSIVAGITYFIPYIGALLSAVMGGALAYLQYQDLGYVFWITITVSMVNNAVDRFITPKVIGDAMGVSTLFVIFAAFAGAEVMGVWGMMLGIPTAVMLQSIFRFIYKKFLDFPVSEQIVKKKNVTQEQKERISLFKTLMDRIKSYRETEINRKISTDKKEEDKHKKLRMKKSREEIRKHLRQPPPVQPGPQTGSNPLPQIKPPEQEQDQ